MCVCAWAYHCLSLQSMIGGTVACGGAAGWSIVTCFDLNHSHLRRLWTSLSNDQPAVVAVQCAVNSLKLLGLPICKKKGPMAAELHGPSQEPASKGFSTQMGFVYTCTYMCI